MAISSPGDLEHFATVAGVREYKLAKYGPAFIDEIRTRTGHLPA